jgi:hypothetical protein
LQDERSDRRGGNFVSGRRSLPWFGKRVNPLNAWGVGENYGQIGVLGKARIAAGCLTLCKRRRYDAEGESFGIRLFGRLNTNPLSKQYG